MQIEMQFTTIDSLTSSPLSQQSPFGAKEALEAKGKRGRLQIGQCGNSEAKQTQLGNRWF